MKILLTISGGIDSMYLAERAQEFFPGSEFAVAHCNFQLRGEESDGDMAFVEDWCKSQGMECHCKIFDTEKFALENGLSIEMAARKLRYDWFGDLCCTYGYDAIAVAHNANDNAETMMLNILRGTGIKGIRGMSEDSTVGGIHILRPLLGTTREEIDKWMRSEGKQWREDRTNAESEYKRNKLRNLVFPIFKEINPSFVRTINEDLQRFRLVDDIAEDYLIQARKSICNANEIDIRGLLALKHWKYVLWRLVEHCSFSAETFEKMTELLERYQNEPLGTVTIGGKLFESPTHIVKIVRKKLLITDRVALPLK